MYFSVGRDIYLYVNTQFEQVPPTSIITIDIYDVFHQMYTANLIGLLMKAISNLLTCIVSLFSRVINISIILVAWSATYNARNNENKSLHTNSLPRSSPRPLARDAGCLTTAKRNNCRCKLTFHLDPICL